jgi:tetratricopeptide (TPR) repeat protein
MPDAPEVEMLIVQVCEFLDVGDGVYRFHTPSRALSRLPGVTVIDCDLNHRLLPPLAEKADVLVLAAFDWDWFPLLEHRRSLGRITVFEANDYYYDVQPWNPLSAKWLDRTIQDSFRQGLTLADAVQTSTEELARRWRERTPRPVAVFQNQLTDIPPLPLLPDRPLTIGWGGSPGHFADWYHVAPVLEKWLRDHTDIHLSVMNHEFAKPFIQLPAERYRYTPFGSLAEYLRFLRGLDIGLAPLLPTDYNRCRSDVKFLEYASQGVAGIYTDLETYRGSVVHGETGLIYKTPEELVQCLDRLRKDVKLRQRIRQQAHQYVAEHRRLEQHIGKRLDFYKQLLASGCSGCPQTSDPGRTLTRSATGISEELLSSAVREDRYLQLRRQQPEETLLKATSGTTSRESVQLLQKLVEEHPNYLNALQHLGRMLNDLREHRAALPVLERARALNPKSARTLCEIGRAQYNLREDAKARETLESALNMNPYYQVGWQYLIRMGTIIPSGDGPQWAERAHELHPSNFALALLGVKVYPPAQGVNVLRKLLDCYAPTFMAEELPAAAAAFSETIRDVAGPLLGTPTVLELLQRGCEVFPQSSLMAYLLGRALYQIGRHSESNEQYARAMELRRAALTYRHEFPKEDGTFHFWQFAEHIRSVLSETGKTEASCGNE